MDQLPQYKIRCQNETGDNVRLIIGVLQMRVIGMGPMYSGLKIYAFQVCPYFVDIGIHDILFKS